MGRPINKGTQRSCQNLQCPVNVDGMCGPASIKLKYRRKITLINSLPLWKRIFFGLRLRQKALKRARLDYKKLMDYARERDPVAVRMAELTGIPLS